MAEKRRKRKTVLIQESSSSDEETSPFKEDNDALSDPLLSPKDTPRSSERLQKKRCREFHKPTREDVWKKITPTKSPGKYEQLRPKRLVNNYTKENNRYNYDPNETSGDESMEDFLDDSVSEQSSSEDARKRSKQKRQIRIKGRHRRLLTKSGSDDSSSSDSDAAQEKNDDQNTIGQKTIEKNDDILSGDSAICVETSKNRKDKLNAGSDDDNNYKNDTDEETEDVTVRKANKHNRSRIESDDDKDYDDTGDSTDKEDVIVKRKHNRSIIESDEDDTGANKNDGSLKSKNLFGNSSENVTEEKENNLKSDSKLTDTDCDTNTTNVGDRKRESSNYIEHKKENALSPNTTNNSLEANNTADGSEVIVDLVNETSGTSESESDSDEMSEESDEEISDDDKTVGHSSRVRVQMLKRKNERKKLFDKFRKERQRRLSKEH
ncbi:clumping factor A-like isoform X4 [Mercenaria mercenaria]|uniref:clumping factor A-like isoform X4 n=1 Tax=Mercenaria mercenaria TaxID=6596 RepID=UPI00234E5198|nr:clumping factor A-like isoform X4 [Mercenaria mercenaria]